MSTIHTAALQKATSFLPFSSRPLNAQLDEHKHLAVQEIHLYRLPQVLARIPISRSAWYAGISSGRYPRPCSLGPRTAVWRSDEIDLVVLSLINQRVKP